ncbi:hypothetical protein JVT61DRAFT_11907 [Boletus reticuloceps]|uniref:Uncharacterized protein n=1 Tax=Boletus reticuloceps TaxID=495285 RepID=A0A8I2YXC6_9AGAM|nr:hypothetical protein JVT61DRAFT_11907 [Boletus reticuloceps]
MLSLSPRTVIVQSHPWCHQSSCKLSQFLPIQFHGGTGILHLSHEGVIPGRCLFHDVDLIQKSVVDPVSGGTSIRFLHQFFRGSMKGTLHLSCIDVILPRNSSTNVVLQIRIDLHDIADMKYIPGASRPSHSRYVEFSDDGHVRGFWLFFQSSVEQAKPRFLTRPVCGLRSVAILGENSMPRWKQINNPTCSQTQLMLMHMVKKRRRPTNKSAVSL